jgi:sterol desaturase/sphingolipid hydroxylase (fatty acid hydroxylase superfamily)
MNSNFGFNFSFWDRLFKTYRAQPGGGHEAIRLGIDEFRAPTELALGRMLRQPWI